MSVRIAAQFTGEARSMNGLDAISDAPLEDPREKRYLIAEYTVRRITEDIEDGGTRTPTITLVHVEPVLIEKDEKTTHALLQKAYIERQKGESEATGQTAINIFSEPEK